MAFDRDGTLKKAEKLVRQGKLDLAIAEYVCVVEDNPGDWSTANTLGELYARAGQPAQAVEQYARIAQHFAEDGFYPKAAALYKKILKITPNDEAIQVQLAEISAAQGLLADAKSYLNAVAAKRKARGDRRGAAEITITLGSIDPVDFEARFAAARTLEEMGEEDEAAARFRALHDDLVEKGRTSEALDALRELVTINPLDAYARSTLAKAALAAGDVAGARAFLDEHSAGDDPALLLPLAEIELRAGALAQARSLFGRLLAVDPGRRAAVADIGWTFAGTSPEATFVCLETATDAAIAAGEVAEGAAVLRDFVSRVPGQIPALLKLVEVCVDGGLEAEMYEAQERLTDAYLAANQGAEARAIAEDLVAREPWEPAHIDRFRRALVLLRVSDPDMLIAERLSGQAPFMARDPFFDPPAAESAAAAETSASLASNRAEPAPVDAGAEKTEAQYEVLLNSHRELTGRPDAPSAYVTAAAEQAPAAEAAAAAPVTASPSSGEEIDLTGALGNLQDGALASKPAKNIEQVFSEIRESAGSDQDFSSQHMTLARTYLEIGMLDEAVSSLQTAVRSPRHRFEAAAALGRLYDRRGDPLSAIEWMERAAEAPAPTEDAAHALLYDLGVLLEGAGETSRALAVFLELQANAGDYRDVPSRIDRLARVQTGG
ncbi:MAG TPA: tetratricopeptide repeat protein [Vicinamibacterales bacterium]|nr:tetratricopeptide repeat protein [Vicinamibacterales bacterium]